MNMKSVYLTLTATVTVVCVLMISVCYGSGKRNRSIIEAVTRRVDSDLYYVYPANGFSSHCYPQQTYMIEDGRCIKNEDLLTGKYVHSVLVLWLP